MSKSISIHLIVLLASVFAITPFAIDTYLPAIPTIASDFNVAINWVSITVSLYVFGLAFGQLIGGQLADRYGRRPVMVSGLLIFFVAGFGMALSQSIEFFWGFRLLQALGAGAAIVCVPAIIRDNAEGKEAARLFSLIALIMMLAPSVAPSIGATILHLFGWHEIFIFLGLIGLVLALCSVKMIAQPKASAQHNKADEGQNLSYLQVLSQRPVLGYLLAQGFGFSVMMTFIANAPFAYMQHFHVSESLFSVLFLCNVIGLVTVNRINSWLLKRHEPAKLLVWFTRMQVVGATILLLVTYFMPEQLIAAVIGFIIMLSANQGIMPNTSSCYLQYFRHNAGKASGVIGSLQFLVGALVSALAAYLTHDSLWPMAIICALASCVGWWGAKDGLKRHSA